MSALKTGAAAPEFSMQASGGKTVRLSDFTGKTVVLYFYPKDDTPGCTTQACGFRDTQSQFGKADAVVLGVSKDSTESHEKFAKKYGLPFTLLSDPDGSVCAAYGVFKEKSMYGRTFMGIERTTFVIDPQGRIAAIFPKVNVNGHAEAVLEAVRSASTAPSGRAASPR